MQLFELLIVAVGLSMDAFAAAICRGLSTQEMKYKQAAITGCFFGGFQAVMPLIGYVLGTQFKDSITAIDHWLAFILLSLIGIKMIRESKNSCEIVDASSSLKNLTVLSIATSIDALAVGVTFAFLQIHIIPAILMIGVTTFLFSFFGVKLGNLFGIKYKSKAELTGGVILIAMGLKILVEHLDIL